MVKYKIARLYHIKQGLPAQPFRCAGSPQKLKGNNGALHGRHIDKHHNIVAEASANAEKMEKFMVAKTPAHMSKERKLQGVNHAADGVNNAARKQPRERTAGERCHDIAHREHAQPAHQDINHGRKPFRAGNPEQCLQNPD